MKYGLEHKKRILTHFQVLPAPKIWSKHTSDTSLGISICNWMEEGESLRFILLFFGTLKSKSFTLGNLDYSNSWKWQLDYPKPRQSTTF